MKSLMTFNFFSTFNARNIALTNFLFLFFNALTSFFVYIYWDTLEAFLYFTALASSGVIVGGISPEFLYFCAKKEERGFVYKYIHFKDNKFNLLVFLLFSLAIASLYYQLSITDSFAPYLLLLTISSIEILSIVIRGNIFSGASEDPQQIILRVLIVRSLLFSTVLFNDLFLFITFQLVTLIVLTYVMKKSFSCKMVLSDSDRHRSEGNGTLFQGITAGLASLIFPLINGLIINSSQVSLAFINTLNILIRINNLLFTFIKSYLQASLIQEIKSILQGRFIILFISTLLLSYYYIVGSQNLRSAEILSLSVIFYAPLISNISKLKVQEEIFSTNMKGVQSISSVLFSIYILITIVMIEDFEASLMFLLIGWSIFCFYWVLPINKISQNSRIYAFFGGASILCLYLIQI
jgi:hypothetical protein